MTRALAAEMCLVIVVSALPPALVSGLTGGQDAVAKVALAKPQIKPNPCDLPVVSDTFPCTYHPVVFQVGQSTGPAWHAANTKLKDVPEVWRLYSVKAPGIPGGSLGNLSHPRQRSLNKHVVEQQCELNRTGGRGCHVKFTNV
jgi:hypothetical protein